MDASRRPGRPRADPDGLAALDAALAGLGKTVSTLAVGLSGGPDSVALARCAAQHARAHQLSLHFLHIDHGLLPEAAAWTRAVEQIGDVLGVPVHVARVHVDTSGGAGIEAAAREARYAALAESARRHDIDVVLLAHHQDDVAETVLFRLLRGSGVEGVRGMRVSFDIQGVTFLRPWLALPRAPLRAGAEAWTAEHGIPLADDPSNLDVRHARGALRRDVLPAIAAHWPRYRDTLTRFARQADAAAEVLRDVAASDLASIAEAPDSLRLSGLLSLSGARQAMALRAWLAAWQLQMPSDARLQDLLEQLRHAGPDRQVAWTHAGCVVRRYRDRVTIAACDTRVDDDQADADIGPIDILWRGEPSIEFDVFDGTLHVDPVAQGIDPTWLQSRSLTLRRGRNRDRLQLHADRPSRTLKNLHQELGIPAWLREALPVVLLGDRLVYAAGIGADLRVPQSAPGVRLRWVARHPGVAFTA